MSNWDALGKSCCGYRLSCKPVSGSFAGRLANCVIMIAQNFFCHSFEFQPDFVMYFSKIEIDNCIKM